MHIEGLPTVLAFHRKIVDDPAFIGDTAANTFGIYTRWIETEWVNDIPAWGGSHDAPAAQVERTNVTVEVGGKRIEVSLPARLVGSGKGGGAKAAAPKRKAGAAAAGGNTGNSLKAPMQSTVVKIAVEVGQTVSEGELVVVLEAMKMEQPMTAHRAGVIKSIGAAVGETVPAGTVLLVFED
jgi:acetyl-CoA/propionyl-CoA carboxylase biotin carboxyl carrier protein